MGNMFISSLLLRLDLPTSFVRYCLPNESPGFYGLFCVAKEPNFWSISMVTYGCTYIQIYIYIHPFRFFAGQTMSYPFQDFHRLIFWYRPWRNVICCTQLERVVWPWWSFFPRAKQLLGRPHDPVMTRCVKRGSSRNSSSSLQVCQFELPRTKGDDEDVMKSWWSRASVWYGRLNVWAPFWDDWWKIHLSCQDHLEVSLFHIFHPK